MKLKYILAILSLIVIEAILFIIFDTPVARYIASGTMGYVIGSFVTALIGLKVIHRHLG